MTEPNEHTAAVSPPASAPGRFPAWVAPVALVLAAVGTLLSLWSLKTASDNAPGVKLTGESKARVCSAFAAVSKAVSLQTHGGAEPLPEPTATPAPETAAPLPDQEQIQADADATGMTARVDRFVQRHATQDARICPPKPDLLRT